MEYADILLLFLLLLTPTFSRCYYIVTDGQSFAYSPYSHEYIFVYLFCLLRQSSLSYNSFGFFVGGRI